MPLGKNRIKLLASLKMKKFRLEHRLFLMEGEKMVDDLLQDGNTKIRQLIASGEWLAEHGRQASRLAEEIVESDTAERQKISSLETPPQVIAVLDLPAYNSSTGELSGKLSIALETVQDPGNLGTIIRTADWFGIRQIICSENCADCFNPKAVQASMGALLRVRVFYADLPGMIGQLTSTGNFPVFGTFMQGQPVYELPFADKGLILFGNESKGISGTLQPFVSHRITIPPGNPHLPHVESLNVASAVAVVCSVLASR